MKNRPTDETDTVTDMRTELESIVMAAEAALSALKREDPLSFRLAVIALHTRAGLVLHHLAAEL